MNLGRLRLTLWVLIAVIVVAIGTRVLMVRAPEAPKAEASFTPIAGVGGPFSLLDQKRRPFTETDLQGRPTALYFGYTFCPDVCPTTLLEMSGWARELGADASRLRMVFVSVDPERDTPEKLGDYVSSFDDRIVALSGSRAETDRIMAAYRVYARKVPGEGADYTMDHTAAVYLLDDRGRFVGIVNFQEPTDKAMAKIRKLLGIAG